MKTSKLKIAALILAGGNGSRFGGDVPKQYYKLMGRTVLEHSIAAFKNHPLISDVCIVADANYYPSAIRCGATRQESVCNGLEALRTSNPDFVLIHDAARPLVSAELITRICEELAQSDAVIPGLPVTDTLKRNGKTESRDGLYTVQTPQAFKFDMIHSLHKKFSGETYTDDAALCEAAGQPVKIISGERNNIKITYPDDITTAEQILLSQLTDIRTGQGYDVHRLVLSNGKKLMLGGIAIEHDKTPEGHSDADVALHAITDAILGTICDGDIGEHFNPKDARWKNADSALFLKHAAGLVAEQGGIITHIDLTILCEEPKISPHRTAMRERIADILGLNASRISVKATTTEGLGFTGRGEGIVAQAVATVKLPLKSALTLTLSQKEREHKEKEIPSPPGRRLG